MSSPAPLTCGWAAIICSINVVPDLGIPQIKIILLFLPIITSINAEVTIASWGGAYTDSQIKGYKNTYTKPSSIKFVDYNGELDDVREQVESGNVKWDIIDVLPDQAISGCKQGLFENISSKYK